MHPDLQEKNFLHSPSLSRFYGPNLADVAEDVTFSSNGEKSQDLETFSEEDVDEDDFEFNLPDLVLQEGEIRPLYPVFDLDLMRDFDLVGELESRPSNPCQIGEPSRAQNQLHHLFLEDRDPPSSSSSDADDLDRIPAGTYCVWAAKKSPSPSASPGRCTKSRSTGLLEKPKPWKLRDLMKRSSSDGKDGGRRMMLLTPKKKAEAPPARRSGHSSPSRAVKETAAHERYREGGEKNKRRSYMPYKQGLVGFFVTPQALRKSYLPNYR